MCKKTESKCELVNQRPLDAADGLGEQDWGWECSWFGSVTLTLAELWAIEITGRPRELGHIWTSHLDGAGLVSELRW